MDRGSLEGNSNRNNDAFQSILSNAQQVEDINRALLLNPQLTQQNMWLMGLSSLLAAPHMPTQDNMGTTTAMAQLGSTNAANAVGGGLLSGFAQNEAGAAGASSANSLQDRGQFQDGTQFQWLNKNMVKASAAAEEAEKDKKKRQKNSMWRKYGQKRMKGKECEGLDIMRCLSCDL